MSRSRALVIGPGEATRDVVDRIAGACSSVETMDAQTLGRRGQRRAEVEIVCTVLANADELRAVLLGPHRLAPADGDTMDVIDLTPAMSSDTREIALACRAGRVHLHAARRLAWFPGGQRRSLLYVDAVAPVTGSVADVLAALAEQVVRTTDAKTIGMLTDVLVGVNAVALREALTLGRGAGVNLETLVAMLQQGSGATALLGQAVNAGGSRGAGGPEVLIEQAARDACTGLATALLSALRVEHSLFFGSLGLATIGSGLHPNRARAQAIPSNAAVGVA
jgi:3-hydroxyisobutyrate dehydrogenase-like beta-hydroxyacid dehydrogenase